MPYTGKIVRTGPNLYSIDDPAAVKAIYGIGTRFIKSDWYDGWGDPRIELANIFALRKPDVHSRLRRKLANAYSMSTLVTYEPQVDQTIELFCTRLAEREGTGKPIDMAQFCQFYTFDVIGEVTVSELPFPLQFINNPPNVILGGYLVLQTLWLPRLRLRYRQHHPYHRSGRSAGYLPRHLPGMGSRMQASPTHPVQQTSSDVLSRAHLRRNTHIRGSTRRETRRRRTRHARHANKATRRHRQR